MKIWKVAKSSRPLIAYLTFLSPLFSLNKAKKWLCAAEHSTKVKIVNYNTLYTHLHLIL